MAFKQRNHAFDLLCGICILRMIVLHVAGFCGMRGFLWCEKMMAWTFFFMSFFFFKAGYFNKTVSGNSKEYCIDRTKRLLVPYISWTLIGDAIFFGMMLFNLDMFMPYLVPFHALYRKGKASALDHRHVPFHQLLALHARKSITHEFE